MQLWECDACGCRLGRTEVLTATVNLPRRGDGTAFLDERFDF